MNLRYILTVAFAGLALSQPVAAQERDAFDKLDAINPEVLFKGIIREDDVSLLFRHLRESVAASARGEVPRESEAVTRRSEEIQREVAARGSILLDALLSAVESAARQAIREVINDMPSRNSRVRQGTPGAGY